jgi:glutaminyl-tRNA synthetase
MQAARGPETGSGAREFQRLLASIFGLLRSDGASGRPGTLVGPRSQEPVTVVAAGCNLPPVAVRPAGQGAAAGARLHAPRHGSRCHVNSQTSASPARSDFIREIVAADVHAGRVGTVVTRFPPEPNGYLHIGHAKSICLNFGVASEFGGRCHLRFDDTNPAKEEQEYIDAIQADVRWLGFDWGEHLYFASDYFEQLYEWAVYLIRAGKAYVDDLSADEIRDYRGTLTEPGRNSPWRDRSVEENLDLFERMRRGEFPNGARVLRARIDMASPNVNLRDPVLYRIVHASHPRTGDRWCIYPTYDFAHGQSDAIEGVTHSICTLEFEAHRPLYDWLIENLPVPSRPHQYEFARLNLTYTVLSKRVLLRLVNEGRVRGWDDPRMPTISGLRRRGFPAQGIRDFAAMIGVAKSDSVVEVEMLEHAARDVLNATAARKFAVLDPLKLVIENYPEGQTEEMEVPNNPEDASAGSRRVPFTRELWIERDDFMENPPAKFFRLAPGREVRLRAAYFVTCREVVRDSAGRIVELRGTYDPATRGGDAPDGRRPKATLHWLAADHALPAEVRLYDHLFSRADPGADGGDLFADLNPDSEQVLQGCLVERSLAEVPAGETVQFERLGYFTPDPDSRPDHLVFNRTLTLRDTWARLQAQGRGGG